MSKITFAVNYSESFRTGNNCPLPPIITLDIDPAVLKQEDRNIISERLLESGIIQSRREDDYWQGGSSSPVPIVATSPKLESLIEAIKQENIAIATFSERKKAKEQAEIEKARQLCLNEMTREPMSASTETNVYLCKDGTFTTRYISSPLAKTIATFERKYITYYSGLAQYLTSEEKAAYQDRDTKLTEDNKKRELAAVKAAGERLHREHYQPHIDWIAAYGSARLKRLVAEKIGYEKTYEKERADWEASQRKTSLEAKRPGWFDFGPIANADDYVTNVSDVGPRSFSLLDAARLVAPTAKLAKVKNGPIPTGQIVAVEDFEGRLIGWPA